MRLFMHIIIVLTLFTITLTTPCFAMEPFYKGKWDMTPAEIAALYAPLTPDEEQLSDTGRIIQTYTVPAQGAYDYETVYYFDKIENEFRLNQVYAPFQLNDGIAVEDFEALTQATVDELIRVFEKSNAQYKYYTTELKENAWPRKEIYHFWLNDTDCIRLQTVWNDVPDDGLPANAYIDIDFYNAAAPGFDDYAAVGGSWDWSEVQY